MDNIRMAKFGETLRMLMKERKTTVKELSIVTGIPVSTISEWCANRLPRFTPEILKVANFFNVSLEYLLTGKQPKEAHIKIVTPKKDELIQIEIRVQKLDK